MKFLILATTLLQLSTTLIRADIPGTFLNRTHRGSAQPAMAAAVASAASDQQQQCDGQQFYSTCVPGICEMVQVCLGTSTEYRYCSMVNPEKPFCNRGECSSEPDFSGGCEPNHLWCTGEGFFPDPHACSLYHYCEDANVMSDVIVCPSGYVYNPVTTMCKKDIDCVRIKCDPDQVLAPYGDSERYFGFCQMEGLASINIRMYQCPDDTKFTGKGCEYVCSDVGRFGVSSDPALFYTCMEQGLAGILTRCAEGKLFDTIKRVCTNAPTTK